jgi:hypothetical protein
MGEAFEVWAARVATWTMTDPDAAASAIDLAPEAWLRDVFQRWGPLSRDDLAQVALIERAQLEPLVVRRLRQLLAPVLADARAWDNEPDVHVQLDEDLNVLLAVSWAAGRLGGPTGSPPLPVGEAEMVAWLADAVQEVTMERDQVDCRVWPVCSRHHLGGHAMVRAGAAIWWCNGGSGHLLAPIGKVHGGGGRREP